MMKNLMITTLFFFCCSSLMAYHQAENSYQLEKIYDDIHLRIESSWILGKKQFISLNQSLIIDALEDRLFHREHKSDEELKLIDELSGMELSLLNQWRVLKLMERMGEKSWKSTLIQNDLKEFILSGQANPQMVYTYWSEGEIEGREIYPREWETWTASQAESRVTNEELKALLSFSPSKEGARLFIFCREKRKYPCRMLLKNKHNEFHRNKDGSLWHQPALGHSRRKIPYHKRNGDTPAGVYSMDGVMPYANKPKVFGKYRRVILNFISQSQNEAKIKQLLPSVSHRSSWWKEGVVARDVGRNLLRIHGTGLKNFNPFSSYHPFVATSGCVAQREGRIGKKTYRDQRYLLNALMSSLDLEVEYDNETNIQGTMYLIELDNQDREVSWSDLAPLVDENTSL